MAMQKSKLSDRLDREAVQAFQARSHTPEEYSPDPDSALHDVARQARGESLNVRNQNDVTKHDHDGVNSKTIPLKNLSGFIRTVTAVPTWTPKGFFDQIVIYDNSGTYSLYIYETTSGTWVSEVLS